MKLAFIFRGDNVRFSQDNRNYVDVFSCYENWKNTLFSNLIEHDIIFITYESDIIQKIKDIIKPKHLILVPKISQYSNFINIIEFMKDYKDEYTRFIILRCDHAYKLPILLWPKWNSEGITILNRDVHWPSQKYYSDVLFICDSMNTIAFEDSLKTIDQSCGNLHAIGTYLYNNNIPFNLMYDEYYHMDAHPLTELFSVINKKASPITDVSHWNCNIVPSKLYVSGGKTGDLIHALSVIHANWINGNGKGILTLSNSHGGDAFSLGLEQTYNEIKPILLEQEYIQDVTLSPNNSNLINLNNWRNHRAKQPWPVLLSSVYNIDTSLSAKSWIHLPESYNRYPELNNKTVLHHSLIRSNNLFPWESIIKQNDCIFITCNQNEYSAFRCKDSVDVLVASNLVDFASMIYSSKCFVGNMSMPCALAWAIGKPLLCAVSPDPVDQLYYMCDHISWFKDLKCYSLNTVKDILVLNEFN
jgi:hypothetical protein